MNLTEDEAISLFRAIVGREPADPYTIRSLMRMDLKAAIDVLFNPNERTEQVDHWGRHPAAEDVDFLYQMVLERDVESDEVRRSALKAESIATLMNDVILSDEFRGKIASDEILRKSLKFFDPNQASRSKAERILLFGGYGNGNLGDRDQASAIGRVLIDHGIDPAQLVACSWLDTADYPFQGRKRSSTAIVDPDLLSDAALIIIGGGGLFGTPHYPLSRIAWVDALIESGTPYMLWAIGGSDQHIFDPAFEDVYAKLFRNAAAVSARDEETLTALRKIRSDVFFAMDPVLYEAFEIASSGPAASAGDRVDLILRGPNTRQQEKFISEAAQIYSLTSREELGVIFVEPDLPEEKAAMEFFPGCRIACTTEELVRELAGARLGMSMRLHGIGAIIRQGLPAVGLSQPKILSFLKVLNLESQFFDSNFGALIRDCLNTKRVFAAANPNRDIIALSREGQQKLIAMLPRGGGSQLP